MTNLSARLDLEWTRMGRRSALLDTVRRWNLVDPDDPPITSLDDLLRRTGLRCQPTPQSNALLGRLVERARTEPLAARMVLQRLLPGLLVIVRDEQRRSPGVDAFDVLLAEAWMSIVRYPVAARDRDIAARLLTDARHRAFTNPRRRRRVSESPCPPHRLHEPEARTDRSPFEELTGLLADARDHGLPQRDVEVVAGIVNHGSAAQLAVVVRMDARSVRYRRDQAIKRLRSYLREPRLLPVGPRPSTLTA
ncbi:hypothetical protein [Desertimonas flava]|uniref:hypothetical protein n=1 Tax=Desertimonas flava TaxID=2064846 RepID=UPI000E346167|nr:hypothetical protein [Desertimonas flava]